MHFQFHYQKSVVSLIAFASRILAAAVNLCSSSDSDGYVEPAAIVEFKSEQDAFGAVDKVKSTAFGRRWHMKFIKDPKFTNPERTKTITLPITDT